MQQQKQLFQMKQDTKATVHVMYETFTRWYKENKGRDYEFSPKDWGQLKNLKKKIRRDLGIYPQTTPGFSYEIAINLEVILQGIEELENQWYYKNVTPALLVNQYENIVTQIYNDTVDGNGTF